MLRAVEVRHDMEYNPGKACTVKIISSPQRGEAGRGVYLKLQAISPSLTLPRSGREPVVKTVYFVDNYFKDKNTHQRQVP
jgi:hypothetical protein